MAGELNFVSASGLTVTARVFSTAGAQQGGDVACAEVGTNGLYTGDMPTAAAGRYSVVFYSASAPVGGGSIDWDGSAEITLADVSVDLTPVTTAISGLNDLSQAQAQTAAAAALTAYDPPTNAELTAATSNLDATVSSRLPTTDYTAPVDVSGDVSAIRATTDQLNFSGGDVVATLDGEAVTTDAASRTASQSDLTGLATTADLANLTIPTTAEIAAAVGYAPTDLTGIARTTELQPAAAAALAAYDPPTKAELDAGLGSVTVDTSGLATQANVTAIQASIAALNDISAADVRGEVDASIAATSISVNLTPVTDAIDGLNDLSTTDVRTEVDAGLSAANLTVSLTAADATRLQEIHRIHGLESGAPLVVTDTSRTTTGIAQTIVENATTATVTRTT
ncbi:MAG: hypothetical protein AAF205_00065 [Pseudomonadota bacterium]